MIVKVWNDNFVDHNEEFRGDKISVKSGGFIEMDYLDAVQFLGQFSPIQVDQDGKPTEESRKMLRIQRPRDDGSFSEQVAAKANQWTCQFDGKSFPSEAALNSWIEDNHADKILVDELAEKEIAEKARKNLNKKKEAQESL